MLDHSTSRMARRCHHRRLVSCLLLNVTLASVIKKMLSSALISERIEWDETHGVEWGQEPSSTWSNEREEHIGEV